VIKKINGNISYMIDGVFKNDKNIGYEKCTLIFVKNSACSKIFVIKINPKKIKNILKKDLKKRLNKKFMYVFIYF
tara:strand:+ start:399 stop:623 length:225 start_codon:yes stop_codon:yes gene_type:complete